MKAQPIQEEHFGTQVWVNPTTESMREEECLCFSCKNLKPNEPDNCPIAQALYQICVREKVALTLTRCPEWAAKESAPQEEKVKRLDYADVALKFLSR
ncbi:hypothetical protein A2635_03130 [Candidatus Peribacteria bacterium RIFCSPHIGHO2_01_FULL_51_9]|nr:MAG: hypothetical protein A2635_03130 [Candidatus Peribacteria bacterium RIFCSPHIGHO2_01_FULL_51_9]